MFLRLRSHSQLLALLFALTLLISCAPVRANPDALLEAPSPETAAFAVPVCEPGPCFFTVNRDGKSVDNGNFTAQCTGRFVDYIDRVPADYTGPRFRMAQDYPTTPPPASSPDGTTMPWQSISLTDTTQVNAYLFAVRDYIYADMLAADWVAGEGGAEDWYHVPWMTVVDNNPREYLRGVTNERGLRNGEMGLKTGAVIANRAIGYYNEIGAYTIGQVWADASHPRPELSQFAEGTVVVKVLFSDAKGEDFADGVDILAGSPTWQVNYNPPDDDNVAGDAQPLGTYPMRLMQMDIAVRDDDAGITGWVFGTFAYDANPANMPANMPANTPAEQVGWYRMMPVGLMWGNDEGLTAATYATGARPQESLISDMIPPYALTHLGYLERLNGPVDNPASSCLSCHSTAESPAAAFLYPEAACQGDKLDFYFRTLAGDQPFGQVIRDTCTEVNPPTQALTALDYSLQMRVALSNQSAQEDGAPKYNNPCIVDAALADFLLAPSPSGSSSTIEEYPTSR